MSSRYSSVEETLEAVLHEHARGADRLAPLGVDFRASLIHRGRRIRHRRTAVLAVAVMSVCVGVGIGALDLAAHGRQGRARVSVPSTQLSPVWSEPAPTRWLATRIHALPVGPALVLPLDARRRAGRIVVSTPTASVTLPPSDLAVHAPTQTAAGALFWAATNLPAPDDSVAIGGVLYLLRPSGDLAALYRGVFMGAAISPDGTQFAVAQLDIRSPGTSPVTVVVRTLAGQEVGRTVQPHDTRLIGWRSKGILLARGVPPTSSWTPGQGPSWWPGGQMLSWWTPGHPPKPPQTYLDLLPVNSDIGLEWPQASDQRCWRVVDFGTGRTGPLVDCDSWPASLSPGAEYAVDGLGRVHDTRTGHSLTMLPDLGEWDTLGPMWWEDATHVVVPSSESASESTEYARCDVTTGTCERAPAVTSAGTPDPVAWEW